MYPGLQLFEFSYKGKRYTFLIAREQSWEHTCEMVNLYKHQIDEDRLSNNCKEIK